MTGSGITLNDANLVSNSDGITFSSLTATKNEDGNPSGAGLGGGVTAAKQTLKNYERNWISDKEGMIQTAYGWTVDSAYDWRLQSNENGQPGYSAAVFWGSLRDVDRMEIETGLLVAISSGIQFDQVIAHEMVHVLQHQNTY